MPDKKRIVLITGCSSGIGMALARAFHAHGDTVYATARRLESISALSDMGMKTLALDVLQPAQFDQVISTIGKEQGRLDILVNNAGYAAIGPLAEMPMTQLRREFETNVLAPMALIQSARYLLRSAKGCVIQIGSVSATLTTPFAGAYCASKAALHNLSDALRMELAPFGIRVLIVAPGAIRSGFGEASNKGLNDTLAPDSWYAPVRDAIAARATASQENPSSAEDLAQVIVREAGKTNPRAIVRFGKGSRLLFLLKRLIPERTLDGILMKKFRLDKL